MFILEHLNATNSYTFTMDYSSLSGAHDHLDYVLHAIGNWTQDPLEGDDDLRVACEGLRKKCQLMNDTLDDLLDCDEEAGEGDGDRDAEGLGSDEVSRFATL
jgi:hypothetical protein